MTAKEPDQIDHSVFLSPKMVPVYLLTFVAAFGIPIAINAYGISSVRLSAVKILVVSGVALFGLFLMTIGLGVAILGYQKVRA